jgi:hypothetical protein
MKKNVGSIDAIVRIVIGLAIVGFAFTLEGSMRWIGLAALVPFATAAVGFCPLYTLLGINTCPLKQ